MEFFTSAALAMSGISGLTGVLIGWWFAQHLCNKRTEKFATLTEAIKETELKLLDRRAKLKEQHAKFERLSKEVTEKIVDLNQMAKAREAEVAELKTELETQLNKKTQWVEKQERALLDQIATLERQRADVEKQAAQKRSEVETLEKRSNHLLEMEANEKRILEQLTTNTRRHETLTGELEKLEHRLQSLKSTLDLYTRIEDYIEHGMFEEPEYLHDTPDRYQVEIKRIRDEQKSLIKENLAVDLPKGVKIDGSSKTGDAVLSGQARLMLRAFNIECDHLMEKLNPSNFDRTLERIEKIAEGLEKTSVSLVSGITTQYMTIKFEECRLLYEYKLKKAERDEEQRQIREQMREEAKAKAEYDRAIDQAEKEERLYRDLLEKARRQVVDARDEQKQELESKLVILEQQLREAEERGLRAKSMAEQTRRGHVYVVSNIGSFGKNVYKIGLTRRLEPLDRVKELGGASVPFLFDVHAMIFSDDAPAMESALHKHFDDRRVNAINRRKEFFHVSLETIRDAVTEISGAEAEFYTTAAADEYYETLRLQGAQ